MYWLLRCAWLSLVLLLQTIIVADLLHTLEEAPDTDVAYVFLFGVTIVYFVISGLILFYSWYTLIYLFVVSRQELTTTAGRTVDNATIAAREESRRLRRILLGNLLVDTTLYVLLVVFFALLIDNLQRYNDGEPVYRWMHIFFVLFLFFIVMFVALLVLAVRTCAEERLQRGDLETNMWFKAAFSDVVAGVTLQPGIIGDGRARRADKTEYYVADTNYHALPMAYLCTPKLTANLAEFVLNWVLFLLVFYLAVVSLLIGAFLDGKFDDLLPILAPVWIINGLLVVLGVVAFAFMCCDPLSVGMRAPARFSIAQKYTVAMLAVITGVVFIVFGVLLEEKIDEHRDIDWWIVMTPLIVFFGGALLLAACYAGAGRSPVERIDVGSGADTPSSSFVNSSARLSAVKNDVARRKPIADSSMWGV